MYTEEQTRVFFDMLGIEAHFYWITVMSPLGVERTTLIEIFGGRYKPVIPVLSPSSFVDSSNSEWFFEEVKRSRQIMMLNAFATNVKLNRVPLYINTIPEVARWRLSIGV